jgi:hypothetical protein
VLRSAVQNSCRDWTSCSSLGSQHGFLQTASVWLMQSWCCWQWATRITCWVGCLASIAAAQWASVLVPLADAL